MLQYVCEFPPASCLTAAGARALFAVLKASRGARTAVVSEPRDRDEEEEAVCGGLLPRLETSPAAQVRPAYAFKLHMLSNNCHYSSRVRTFLILFYLKFRFSMAVDDDGNLN